MAAPSPIVIDASSRKKNRAKPLTANERLNQHRRRLTDAMRKELTADKIATIFRKLMETVENKDEGWIKAAEILLDRAFGKAKVEAELTITGEVDIRQRLELAKATAGLLAKLPDEQDVIDAELAQPSPLKLLPNGINETDRVGLGGNADGVPSVPKEVHQGSEKVHSGSEGGSDGDNIRPQLQVDPEEGVSRPEGQADQ